MVFCLRIFFMCRSFGKFGFEFSEIFRAMGSDEKIFSSGQSPVQRFFGFLFDLLQKPGIWFRETVIKPNQKEYYWYHEKLRRVPTVDQCYTDDIVCVYEANEQYKRDRMVERYILQILKKRYEYCAADNLHDQEDCADLKITYEKAMDNYFIKYGDLGIKDSAINCLMKQKNRMAWERRHGPVGTGRKDTKPASE